MCGIAGVLDADADRACGRVTALNGLQQHRGPDHAVVVRAGSFTLGNTRLAIQDPTPSGNQPFVSADGRFVTVFNGEIYNFIELSEQFRLELPTRCDGALIPELWSRLGHKSLEHLRGMYAIAVVDTVADTLTLARDPFGIKPLHWRRLGDGIAFASELQPLVSFTQPVNVAPEAVARFFHLGSLAADATPFRGVEAVPPNGTVEIHAADPSSPRVKSRPPLDEDQRAEGPLGPVFEEAVDLHLRSDVPTALLLSGGVDSAALAATARHLGRSLHCLTVAGLGPEDESSEAARTATMYGHKHEIVPAAMDELLLSRFFAAMQRPTIDGLNTFLVCKAVRECGYKVALSGLGGDEALGGYSHYRLLPALPLLKRLDRLATVAPKLLEGVAALAGAGPKARRFLSPDGPRDAWGLDLLDRELFPPPKVQALTGIDPLQQPGTSPLRDWPHGQSSRFADLVRAEVALYLQSTLLPDADGFSMCWSVELRVPFVDQAVFSAAEEAVGQQGGTTGKRALARALEDSYLSFLVRQPKRGFSLPMRTWLREGVLREAVDEVGSTDAAVWSLVDRKAGHDTLEVSRRSDRWAESWSFAVLNSWLQSMPTRSIP